MPLIPLESNPEVLNKLLQKLGVPPKIQIVDVYSLDPEMLPFIPQPAYALLLLFPCNDKFEEYKKKQAEELKEKGQVISDKLYFLRQYVRNACGTMAIIHSIANLEGIELGDGYLKQFLDDSRSLSPHERGELLQKCDGIINAHKDIAVEGQTSPPNEQEPVEYHYIAFVQKEGNLYELDGSREFAVNHGSSSEETFLSDAASVCRQYMSRDPENVNFTVMALVAE